MKDALFYEKLPGDIVQCRLCARECKINDGRSGFCTVRENVKGVLYTKAYANPVAVQVDPIEKKPLYHFLPGSSTFSIATAGCNFRCKFCQNWEISQRDEGFGSILSEEEFSPADIVKEAVQNNCQSISYTYTEPTIFYEYAYDIARMARPAGLRNIFVTNGYMTQESLDFISGYLDAANVDLKFFSEDSYRDLCQASMAPVLNTIKRMKKLNIWVEVTTLVIPGFNDSEKELSAIANFISGIDRDIPWHISAFHPAFRMGDCIVTPQGTLRAAKEIGERAGLNFVYAGNVYGWGGETVCPSCKRTIIRRDGFAIKEYNMSGERCINCRQAIPGVF